MHNFGLTQLILVNPAANPLDEEAKRLATHGDFVVHNARVVENFEDAVADCILVLGTSARNSGVFRATSSRALRSLVPLIHSALRRGSVALVFGPEPSGLSNPEIDLCHHLLHIPSNPEIEALNLSQAVGICLYEIYQISLEETGEPAVGEGPAPFADQERMFEHLRRGLEAIHFLYGEKADALMHALRHMIGRAGPTSAEVKILHGLARQMEWVAKQPPGADMTSAPELDEPK